MEINKSLLSVGLFICLLFSIQSCSDREIENKNSTTHFDKICEPIISDFFHKIQSGQYEEGINGLLISNPNMNTDDSVAINLRDQFRKINTVSGKFVKYTLMKKRAIDNDLCVYSYLAKYETNFYRFVFVFYNNNSSVRLYRYSFDSSIDFEVEESLKYYSF